ncbi:MAG: acyltransferase [Lachnospiraceae bacterium]|nr:acyltransferase [Lachnospiraceae bacterium]
MISPGVSKAFRGIAILIVIASHYAGWMYVEPVHIRAHHMISTWGPPGVDIFFLLSGYGLYLSARKGRSDLCPSGISGRFVLRRVTGAVLPYLLIAGLINCYSGAWTQAAAEGTLDKALLDYLTAAEFWYMQVLFVLYGLFLLCFRFGGRFRLPILTVAVILYTIWLYQTGHADFWELSNPAFLIGIWAAASEQRFPEQMKKALPNVLTGILGGIGMAVSFFRMQRYGGSGVPESFGWELVMNLFFTLIILSLCRLIPKWPGVVLKSLGETSLFIYLLHTILFWNLIFRLEALGYARAAMLTGLITLAVGSLAGFLYQTLSSQFYKRIAK